MTVYNTWSGFELLGYLYLKCTRRNHSLDEAEVFSARSKPLIIQSTKDLLVTFVPQEMDRQASSWFGRTGFTSDSREVTNTSRPAACMNSSTKTQVSARKENATQRIYESRPTESHGQPLHPHPFRLLRLHHLPPDLVQCHDPPPHAPPQPCVERHFSPFRERALLAQCR